MLPAGNLSMFADLGLEEWELCAIVVTLNIHISVRRARAAAWTKRSEARCWRSPKAQCASSAEPAPR